MSYQTSTPPSCVTGYHPEHSLSRRIEGWAPPKWATSATPDDDSMWWRRGGTTFWAQSSVEGGNPEQIDITFDQFDELDIDLDSCLIKVKQGQPVMSIDFPVNLTVDQARALTDALLELADIAGGTQN
jgi:hypothetical protein